MTRKEHKGGELTNEQVEKDQKTKHQQSRGAYHGSQDTGDKSIRQRGTGIQKMDGLDKNNSEKPS
jgi:hypothetical protein